MPQKVGLPSTCFFFIIKKHWEAVLDSICSVGVERETPTGTISELRYTILFTAVLLAFTVVSSTVFCSMRLCMVLFYSVPLIYDLLCSILLCSVVM